MYVTLLTAPIAEKYLDNETCLALMLACVCHDIDHRGVNNAFVTKAGGPLGQLYESAVMEQHHVTITIALLAHPMCAVLNNMEPRGVKVVESHVRDIILATDLASYFKRKSEFKTLSESKYDRNNAHHRALLADLLMTSADLSMATKPFETNERLSAILYEEFFKQGDMERELGMDVIPMMDREKCDIPQQQVGFFGFIARDAYVFLVGVVEELRELVERIDANHVMWKEEVKRGEVGAKENKLYLPRI